MARKKRSVICISLTEQERARLNKLTELEERGARAQLMFMVDSRLKVFDPEFLKKSKAADK